MKDMHYGSITQTRVDTDAERHAEEIAVKGYTILTGLCPAGELALWRDRIDTLHARQESAFGRERLAAMHELDMCRAPLLHDFEFLALARHPRVLEVVRLMLGDWFILNLQNAIINRPGTVHHQSAWHRDLPYQNHVISRPLAINALWAMDPFSAETGGTEVVPFTHRTEVLPSDAYIAGHLEVAEAPPGSVILFDSMLLHRAGRNRSDVVRRAVNHLYTKPILKQFYDFPRALGPRPDLDEADARLLGYTSQVPLDDEAWRRARLARLGMEA